MGWKQNRFDQSEYKKRLEGIRDKIANFRDQMIAEELKKMEHLKNVITKANEHKATKNGMDT